VYGVMTIGHNNWPKVAETYKSRINNRSCLAVKWKYEELERKNLSSFKDLVLRHGSLIKQFFLTNECIGSTVQRLLSIDKKHPPVNEACKQKVDEERKALFYFEVHLVVFCSIFCLLGFSLVVESL
jgi:hypothetical protein